MAMLIAWQALNKGAARQDRRFSDRFLIVTPGITVRDRLRVLKPSDPDNAYRQMDLVPAELRSQLQVATVELAGVWGRHVARHRGSMRPWATTASSTSLPAGLRHVRTSRFCAS